MDNQSKHVIDMTVQRMQNLTQAQFEHSLSYLDNYPEYREGLLEAVRGHDFEQIGRAFMLFLYKMNQDDIQLEVDVNQEDNNEPGTTNTISS